MARAELEQPLAIVGARLVDGTGRDAMLASCVRIEPDGRIAAVESLGETSISKGVAVVDAAGMTLLPGLIDGHQHVMWDKSLYATRSLGEQNDCLEDTEQQLVRAGYHVQMALAAGVTTLRDCGADTFSVLALRDMIDRGHFVGPRILACGRMITTTAGHTYTDWGVDSPSEMRKAVRSLASRGVDFIKVMVSGGTTSPGTNITRAQYSLEELRAAVEDAHRLGLQIAGHAISTDSIRLAAQAGFDTIEHCSWIGDDRASIRPDDQAVERMVENNARVDHAIIPRPYLFPEESGDEMTAEEKWWLDMLRVRWPYLRRMQSRGVPVFLGTDAAYGRWPGTNCWPGFQELARAVEVMVRWAGYRPIEALRMVTGDAARALQLDREIGTVEVGKRADMVLVAGDPTSDIRALRDVEAVFRDGRVVARRGQVVLDGVSASSAGPRGWELPGG
ncbi:MAG: amidohydrolase family protein [Chloroflexi bacterium]|nr:amidohydrolase family protein [Chloroflexota bacterium]